MKKTSPVSRSGRFAGGPAADVAKFTESISFDWRLWRHDILGSMAHAEMLHIIGVLKKSELRGSVLPAMAPLPRGQMLTREWQSHSRSQSRSNIST